MIPSASGFQLVTKPGDGLLPMFWTVTVTVFGTPCVTVADA